MDACWAKVTELTVEHGRLRKILFGRIVDKEAAAILHQRDDLLADPGGDGRAAKCRPHYTILIQDPFADIRSAMDNDAAPVSIVIKAFVQAIDTERQPVDAIIGLTSHIKAQAALAG